MVDPFPADAEMKSLWLKSWGDSGPESFAPVLARSLVHIGAYSGDTLVGFVNVAWDGGIHAFILDTCVDRDFQRRGIALAMVQIAKIQAAKRGAQWLHVDFEARLEPFYRQCGFGPTAAGLMRLD